MEIMRHADMKAPSSVKCVKKKLAKLKLDNPNKRDGRKEMK